MHYKNNATEMKSEILVSAFCRWLVRIRIVKIYFKINGVRETTKKRNCGF